MAPLLLMAPFYPFAARDPLSIYHGFQGGHLAHFGNPALVHMRLNGNLAAFSRYYVCLMSPYMDEPAVGCLGYWFCRAVKFIILKYNYCN